MIEQLVYLSPVPWASFTQRPHKFVEWFHATARANVHWFDPYPTRLPEPGDLKRLFAQDAGHDASAIPGWLDIAHVRSLPIEPIVGGTAINRRLWRGAVDTIRDQCARAKTMLVIGKPSAFAVDVLQQTSPYRTVYDCMDNFPSFYSGLSRASIARMERIIAVRVDRLIVSSTTLEARWRPHRPDLMLIPNGLDPAALPAVRARRAVSESPAVFGYLGTLGAWFDWEWLIRLAQCRPHDEIRLIGPLFSPPQQPLPRNITLHPPLEHSKAMAALATFDVGLIPFVRNDLTHGVDPIKYYEYRAVGLPIISTAFGEMAGRSNEAGVFITPGIDGLEAAADEALRYMAQTSEIEAFRNQHSWNRKFDNAGLYS
ncbi:glycosyl transferase [Burkholderia singularis]|uniref:Possible glycosyltransferase n=1 Tax=Burkholderia singularis TaxID=1503053 RepID=A0A238H8F8_9BURK|nr:glycosyl transferase [Burkholderia singularis]SMG01317.1 Possible glycosyltransferase [Burkholderia singularis]